MPVGSTTVTFELELENGGTRVRLHHEGLPSKQEVDQHDKGWDQFLPELARVAA